MTANDTTGEAIGKTSERLPEVVANVAAAPSTSPDKRGANAEGKRMLTPPGVSEPFLYPSPTPNTGGQSHA